MRWRPEAEAARYRDCTVGSALRDADEPAERTRPGREHMARRGEHDGHDESDSVPQARADLAQPAPERPVGQGQQGVDRHGHGRKGSHRGDDAGRAVRVVPMSEGQPGTGRGTRGEKRAEAHQPAQAWCAREAGERGPCPADDGDADDHAQRSVARQW